MIRFASDWALAALLTEDSAGSEGRTGSGGGVARLGECEREHEREQDRDCERDGCETDRERDDDDGGNGGGGGGVVAIFLFFCFFLWDGDDAYLFI